MKKTFHSDRNTPGLSEKELPEACRQCEAMLADALDETLSPADQAAFDAHIASCVRCAEHLDEAQRGFAWLELLKNPRPEPRPELLARILAQTPDQAVIPFVPASEPMPALPGHGLPGQPLPGHTLPGHTLPGHLLPFRPRPSFLPALQLSHAAYHRLAMTAAMAFFSVTMTLSLTGVRLDRMHAADLNPENLRRSVRGAEAGAVRYYDNLRVVHVMESRVAYMEQDLQTGGPNGSQPDRDNPPEPRETPRTPESGRPLGNAPAPPAPRDGTSHLQPNAPEPAGVRLQMTRLFIPGALWPARSSQPTFTPPDALPSRTASVDSGDLV